jgi:hypothetical protein
MMEWWSTGVMEYWSIGVGSDADEEGNILADNG